MYESEKKECSRILYEAMKQTWENRRDLQGEIDSFVQIFPGLPISFLRSQVIGLGLNPDGIGNKIEVAERLSSATGDFSFHRTLAKDLFAMKCDDSACRFQEPFAVATVLETNKPNTELVGELANGMVDAAKSANVAVVGGEYAVEGRRVKGYGEYNYNWSGIALGIFDAANFRLNTLDHVERKIKFKETQMLNRTLTKGNSDALETTDSKNYIVAFQETGPRSNGYSDILESLEKEHGPEWHLKEYNGKNLAEWFLEPSKIFAPGLVELTRNSHMKDKKVYGIAHISGGGIPEKLGRLLRQAENLGADIYDPYEPPESLLYIQKISGMSDRVAYQTFGMGHGIALITENPEYVIGTAKKFNFNSKIIGEIISEPLIRITNKGFYAKENERSLEYII